MKIRFSQIATPILILLGAPAAFGQPDPTGGETPSIDQLLDEFRARVLEMQTAFHSRSARPKDPDWVRAKLGHMVEVDQYTRNFTRKPQEAGYGEAERERFHESFLPLWKEVDAANTEDLKVLLALHGWFRISTFGKEADHQGWLLVQHADQDPDFQKEVLSVLEDLLPEGDTSPSNFAYLYDRVASAEKRPQRYGTQGRCVGPGTWEPNPLEDPERIDELRASVGLGTLAEYKEVFVEICP